MLSVVKFYGIDSKTKTFTTEGTESHRGTPQSTTSSLTTVNGTADAVPFSLPSSSLYFFLPAVAWWAMIMSLIFSYVA